MCAGRSVDCPVVARHTHPVNNSLGVGAAFPRVVPLAACVPVVCDCVRACSSLVLKTALPADGVTCCAPEPTRAWDKRHSPLCGGMPVCKQRQLVTTHAINHGGTRNIPKAPLRRRHHIGRATGCTRHFPVLAAVFLHGSACSNAVRDVSILRNEASD